METNQVAPNNSQEVVINKNMTQCKTCGEQIAKAAKKCPKCGAKNKKKSIVKLIIPLVIILVIAILYSVKVMNTNATKAVLIVNGTEYKWSEYKDLYHEYYLNGKTPEFKEEYLPANAEITGKITKISDAIIGSTMDGDVPNKNTLMEYKITIDEGCTYSIIYGYYEQNNYDFSHLAVGDKVTVKGVVTENELFPTNIVEEYLDAQLEIIGTEDGITKE